MFDQNTGPSPNDECHLVWRKWHGKPYPTVIYGELPNSVTKDAITSPIEITGDDRQLTLEALVAKYPATESQNGKA